MRCRLGSGIAALLCIEVSILQLSGRVVTQGLGRTLRLAADWADMLCDRLGVTEASASRYGTASAGTAFAGCRQHYGWLEWAMGGWVRPLDTSWYLRGQSWCGREPLARSYHQGGGCPLWPWVVAIPGNADDLYGSRCSGGCPPGPGRCALPVGLRMMRWGYCRYGLP